MKNDGNVGLNRNRIFNGTNVGTETICNLRCDQLNLLIINFHRLYINFSLFN